MKNTYYIVKENDIAPVSYKAYRILWGTHRNSMFSAYFSHKELSFNSEAECLDIKLESASDLRDMLRKTLADSSFNLTVGINRILADKIANGENIHVALFQ